MATKGLKIFAGVLLGIVLPTLIALAFPLLMGFFPTVWLSYAMVCMTLLVVTLYLMVSMNGVFWEIGMCKNAILVDRRDGFREFTSAEYVTGWLKSKFGYHLNTEQKPEILSKKNISIALDMYGPTVSPKDVAAVETFAKEYNIQSANELDVILSKWNKCQKCGWEGIPKEKTTTKEVEVGGIKEQQIINEGFKCGNAKCEGTLKETAPSVLVPFYRTVSLEPVKLLMKHTMNPSKCVTLVDRLVRIKMGFGDKIATFVGRMLAYGIFALLFFVGLYIFFLGIGGK